MKKKLSTSFIVLLFLVAGDAFAQFSVINASPSSSSPGGTTTSVPAPSGSTTLPSTRVTCETTNRISLQMLRSLMVGPNDFRISVVEGDQRKLRVAIPAHYGNCLDLKFEYRIVDNNVHVYAENNKSYAEYTSCLKTAGILSQDGRQFDASRATINEPSFEYIDLPEFDTSKNIEAFFMSPNPSPANGNFGAAFQTGWLASSDTCSKRESLQDGGSVVYMSPENEAADRAFRACNSLDYEAILRELERLDASTLGNASVLRAVLQGALDTARRQRANEIYERLGQIEAEFRPSDDDRRAGRRVGVSEDEAIRLSNEYATLLTELNEVVLDPSIREIDALITEHGQTTSRARQTEIQDRVKNLNELVSEYSKRGSRGLRDLYAGLEEYALVDQAEKIEGFRLKSEAFGRVYVGRTDGRRGEQMSVERANRFVTDRMDTFMNQIARDWEDSYRVRNLDASPLRSSQRGVSQAYDRMNRNWQRYQQGEQRNMRRYCGANFLGQVSNPVRCQQFQRGAASRQQRALRMRERDLRNLRRRGEHYTNLNNQYGAAMERFESERMSYDDMGMYSDYNDDFSFMYGDSYGGDSYGMYDMGSMNMSMGGNMGGMRMPASGQGGMQMMPQGGMMMSPMMGQNPFQMGQQQMMVPGMSPMSPGMYQMPGMQTGGMMMR